jgi:hypothetical protein
VMPSQAIIRAGDLAGDGTPDLLSLGISL